MEIACLGEGAGAAAIQIVALRCPGTTSTYAAVRAIVSGDNGILETNGPPIRDTADNTADTTTARKMIVGDRAVKDMNGTATGSHRSAGFGRISADRDIR